MTALQKEAVSMIQSISEERLYFIIQILRGVLGLESGDKEKREHAFAVYDSMRRSTRDVDEREELQRHREEKYGAHGVD